MRVPLELKTGKGHQSHRAQVIRNICFTLNWNGIQRVWLGMGPTAGVEPVLRDNFQS